MLFLPIVLLPGIKDHPDRRNLLMATGLKFRFYGYIVLGLMLVTGILNMYFRGIHFSWTFFNQARYGKLVVVKVILLIAMIGISLVHDLFVGRKALAQIENKKLKQVARWSGRLLLLIALVMALIGVIISRGA